VLDDFNTGFKECIWHHSFLVYFIEKLEVLMLFFKSLVEFGSESFGFWALLCWETLYHAISLLVVDLFKWFISPWFILVGQMNLEIYSVQIFQFI
jgi:hypothetical protein